MICKHCKDKIYQWTCKECGKANSDQCRTCHMEVEHKTITNQNIHICGTNRALPMEDTGPWQENAIGDLEDG